jgi:hypothetical protein
MRRLFYRSEAMKRPPFAKFLIPTDREIWIYFGTEGWTAAKYRVARKLPVLLLPPDKQPEQFRWPVAGKKVLLIQQGDCDILKIPSFANLLFGYGATVVRCIYGQDRFVSYQGKINDKVA